MARRNPDDGELVYEVAQEIRQSTAFTVKDCLGDRLNTREQKEIATATSRAFEEICLKYLSQG